MANTMANTIDISEKRQWTLIGMWISSGQNGYLTQFLKDNNFPHESSVPVVGKYKAAFRAKLDGLKTLTAGEGPYVIKEGIESGRNLLHKKYRSILENLLAADRPTAAALAPTALAPAPTAPAPAPAPAPTDLRIDGNRNQSHLNILASMSVAEKEAFFKIMVGMPDSVLPDLIRIIKLGRS